MSDHEDPASDILTDEPPESGPERRCVLTGAHGTRDAMIRLALGPDGDVLPDLGARAPGRGAWLGVDRVALETAIAKGKLAGVLRRAFRTERLRVPDDLGERIADGLARRVLDRLGLENRAGHLILGAERIVETARAGRVELLLHASDSSIDGRAKIDQRWRAAGGGFDEHTHGIVLPASRERLSVALGRENVVHVAVCERRSAARVALAAGRWLAYTPSNDLRPDVADAAPGAAGFQVQA